MRPWWFRSCAVLALLAAAAAAPAADCWVTDLATPRPGEVWVLCEQGLVRISRDAGRSWQERRLEPAGRWRALAVDGQGYAIAAGSAGRVAWTADGGATWKRAEAAAAAGRDLYAAAAAGGKFWAAGDDGLILHSPDGGAAWIRQRTFTTARIEDIFFLDGEHGWAVGWAGTILITSDGGRFWETAAAEGVYENLSAVWFEDRTHGWAAGAPGLLLRTEDGGRTWSRVAAPLTGLVHSLHVSSRAGVIAGDRILVRNAEGRWEPIAWLPPETFTAASVADAELWVAGPHFLARSRDGGRSWTPVWQEGGAPGAGSAPGRMPDFRREAAISATRSENLPNRR